MLDTRQIHSLSDIVRNPKAHVARMKQTHTPEVLTINGRAEFVVLDTETYEKLREQLQSTATIASLRAQLVQARKNSPREPLDKAEIERRHQVVDELMAETERLGLYK